MERRRKFRYPRRLQLNSFTDPEIALNQLASELLLVATENAFPSAGRVLGEPIVADRDSPAADVSAMDGYAIRIEDLRRSVVPVAGEAQPGQAPRELVPGTAIRIFTGAVIPRGAEAVVMREETDESSRDQVAWHEAATSTVAGANIRVQGENGKAGDLIVPKGAMLGPASIAAAVNFGVWEIALGKRVRVSIIVTGNELFDVAAKPAAWQIRDSNGPTIAAVCATKPWIECMLPTRCLDDAEQLSRILASAIEVSDAVILTGGVSKGDYDYVPEVITGLGAKTIFHRLPIRPGRPILGAVSSTGKLILGLPGNPVSAIVGMTRFGIPLLAKQSGQTDWQPKPSSVRTSGRIDQSLPLHWYRLVKTIDAANVELIDSRGSGDLVALAQSSGFIHQGPGQLGPGPWNFFGW